MQLQVVTPGAAAAAAEPPKPPAPKPEGEEDESEGKGLVPIHNGAVYDNYSWTQSLQDLQASARGGTECPGCFSCTECPGVFLLVVFIAAQPLAVLQQQSAVEAVCAHLS